MKLAVIFTGTLSLLMIKSCEGYPSNPDDQPGSSEVLISDTDDESTEIFVEIPENDEDFLVPKAIVTPTSSCRDPSFERGTCTPLRDCPYLLKLAFLPPFTKDYKLLQTSYCGKFGTIGSEAQLFCCKNGNIVRKQNSPAVVKRLPTGVKPSKSCQASSKINSEYCGITTRIADRVVGGIEAPVGAWPWAAMVGTNIRRPSFGCGGALITDRHVLTAAHCLKDKTEKNLFVRLGEHDISTKLDGKTADVPVYKITRHPNYNDEMFYNDIAILHLAEGVCFRDRIKPICIPDTRWNAYPITGLTAHVIGWGLDSFAGRATNVLKEAEIRILSDFSCRDSNRYNKQIRNFDSILCAGMENKDACQGDSGNSLNIRGNEQRFVAIGVVSFGKSCGDKRFPGVYTKTSKFYEWIRQTTL